MEDKKIFITVFTPTYNRAKTLPRVYRCLCRQTFKDFEWLIIDDGSNDNTAGIINGWKEQAFFPVRYYQQKHSGKHVAINRAVEYANGIFFLIADSDDEFVPETLEFFFDNWQSLPHKLKNELIGIRCLARNGFTNEVIGKVSADMPAQINFEYPLGLKMGWDHEMWGILKTEIMRRYPFPEIKSVYFIPEGLVWNRICRNYQRLLTNKVLRIIYHQDDGFSRNLNLNLMKHALGFYIYYLKNIIDNADIMLKYAPIRFIKDCIQLGRVGMHAKMPLIFTLLKLKHLFKILIFLFGLPAAFVLFTNDRHGSKPAVH